ncbi:amino acid adenylation domain-containing protein [Kordia sp.]|uniref:amino acid adenylation domain-containing protein n=1 Tax=Kordia sp. TaxID=1965332 RepID=UPI003B5C2272
MNKDIFKLLKNLDALGCRLYLEAGKLKLDASKGTLTNELKQQIMNFKEELIVYLSEEASLSESIPAIAEQESYPVSYGQRSLWILSQFEEISVAYNILTDIDLNGTYDVSILQKAMESVIERHEILRTLFLVDESEELKQRIVSVEELGFSLEYVDLQGFENQEGEINKILDKSNLHVFDLAKGPLFRVILLQTAPEKYIFHYNIHHIISDGWSADIFLKDIFSYYNSYIKNEVASLKPLRIQYKDYVSWQRSKEDQAVFSYHKHFWLDKLSGELPVVELPSTKKRPTIRTYNGNMLWTYISKQDTKNLKEFSRKNSGSLFMGLLSVLKVLLYKYTSQTDLIVGTPTAGRTHTDLEKQIGYFVNTLALRNTLNPDASFEDNFSTIKDATFEAYKHQNYPFDHLVENLALPKNQSRSPIFDIMFVLQNNTMAVDMDASEINVNTIEQSGVTNCKFDLQLTFDEVADHLYFAVTYNTDIYDEEIVTQLMTHFKSICSQLLKSPQLPIAEVEYLSPKEVIDIIDLGNNSDIAYPENENIISLFKKQVKTYPNKVAVKFKEQTITYVELDKKATQLSNHILSYGIEKGDFIPICTTRSIDMIIGILAILKSGGVYVPLTPDLPESRIAFVIEDTKSKLILGEKENNNKFSDIAYVALDTITYEDYSENENQTSLTPEGIAYVIYTSGTTGKPKGVLIPHKNVVRLFFNEEALFDFNKDDVWSMFHSYSFDFSVWEMYGALFYGGTLIIVPETTTKDPEVFSELLLKEGVTVLNQTPSYFKILQDKLLKVDSEKLPIRYVIFGGEKLSPEILDRWISRFTACKMINMYGITETTVHVTYKEITDKEVAIGASNIGKTIPTLGSIILDANGNIVPKYVSGELYIYGAGVGAGYLNRIELTSEKFTKLSLPSLPDFTYYKTGDLARMLHDGELEYMGRIDTQVKVRGYRIELGEIATVLRKKEGIKEAEVIINTSENEPYIIAYIVSDETYTSNALETYLSRHLPPYMVPSYFVQVDSFLLTSNGKLDTKALPSPKENSLATGVSYVPPSNELEEKLTKIFEIVLEKELVGVMDSYFSLGGDSIKAITLIIKINKTLQSTIGVAELYMYPSVKELAAYISSEKTVEKTENNSEGYRQIAEIQAAIESEAIGTDLLPTDYEAIYPLVPIEEGMIYSSLIRLDEPVYIDRFVYTITIEDLEEFKSAMQQLADRHPTLRTRYYLETFSSPVKIIDNTAKIPILYTDYRGHTEEELSIFLNDIKDQDLAHRYQFKGELMYNFKLIRLTDNDYYVIWNFHHSILDGWSTSVFIQELSVLLSKNENKTLVDLPYNYVDYCAGVLSRKSKASTSEYWKGLLSDYTRTKLPFNYRDAKVSDTLGMRTLVLNAEEAVVRNLETLSEELQVSFKAVCLAAHAYLLRVICSEEDVVTGVVSHERPELENSDRIIGCFLNTIPTRVNFKNIKTVSELILYMNKYLIDSKMHEIHVSEITNIIGEKASLANPIFDTILNYTHFHINDQLEENTSVNRTSSDLSLELLVPEEMTNTLFDVEISRRDDGLQLRIKYVPAYFEEVDVQNSLEMLYHILKTFPNKGELSPKSVMTEAAYNELVYDFNDTIVEENQEVTMHGLFEAQEKDTPSNIALRQNGETMTYEALNNRANVIASQLLKKGITPATNIGLLCSRSFDMVAGLMGILKAGGSYVPIDPTYPIDRQQYIVENSKVQLVLTNKGNNASSNEFDCEFIQLQDLDYTQTEENPHVEIAGNQLAYTIYTSGSTGRPKGVMIEHYSAVNLIRWVNERFNVNEDDRLLFITSECFDLSVYDMFGMLATGGSIVIATKEEVQDFNKLKMLMRDEKITFWDSVPTTFNYLVDELREEGENMVLPDLRLVFMSGDWIPVQLPNRARPFFPNAEIISLGGATEGTVWSNYYPIEKVGDTWTSIPYGKPMRNNFFYILDDQLRPVPKGTVGELFIGGIGVARGYDNDEKKTNAAFMKDPFDDKMGGRMYKTGDLGRWMRNGNMEFIGRKDNQVKIRGFRVELGEIESVLSKHNQLKEAIVHVTKDSKGQNLLCAYIVPESNYDLTMVRSYLKEKLPEYMIPSFFMELERLPLNSNGKIDRKALPEISQIDDEETFVAATSDLEILVENIWKGVLQKDQISINDNIFDLGANSLSAASFVARFHKKTEYAIGVRDVFLNPTIKELALYVAELEQEQYNSIESVAIAENYPLSDAQRRLWILSQFDETSIAYNISSLFPLSNISDIKRFENAITQTINRHEILRTVFREDVNGVVKQWIIPVDEIEFTIDFTDISKEENAMEIISNASQTDVRNAFDLSTWPLMRAMLYKVSADEYMFYYNIHHIISDGLSIEVLLKDVMRFYELETNEEIPALEIQYKDYTAWQLNQLESEGFEEHRTYWFNKLSGELPIIELPVRKKRPLLKTYNGVTLQTYISQETTQMLKNFVASKNGTLFMGVLSTLKLLLAKYSGQKDIIIGSPVSGRHHADLEEQIGFYVNTLVLRNQIDENDTFNQFFETVKSTTLEAYAHQMYPFDRIVDELNINQDTSRNPIFDVMFTFQGEQKDVVIQQEDEISIVPSSNTSKFDIAFDVFETKDNLSFRVEYNTDIYDRNLIEQFIKDYKYFLHQLLSEPKKTLSNVSYNTKEHISELIEFASGRETVCKDVNVIDLFTTIVENNETAIAIDFENNILNYKDLQSISNQFAHYLQQEHNVSAQDYVVLYLNRSENLFIAILGILKLGAAFVPIDTNYPEERKSFILQDIKAKVCVNEEIIQDFLSKTDILDTQEIPLEIDQDNTAYIIYTSGTTGNPKGVMISHGALSNYIQYAGNKYIKDDLTKFILFTSLSFDLTITTLFAPICHGGSVKIMPAKEHDIQVLEMLTTDDFDIIKLTPAHVTALLDVLKAKEENYTGTPKRFIIGGEALTREVVDRIFEYFGDTTTIWNEYGPTESTVGCIVKEVEKENKDTFVSIGKPTSNVQAYILDQSQNMMPIGVEGEIYLGGKQLAHGYLNQPELTSEKFIQSPFNSSEKLYKTGDYGRWLPNGDIMYHGREDNQIKIRGHRIELQEIEQVLVEDQNIKQAIVTVTEYENDLHIVAYIITENDFDKKAVRKEMNRKLPEYMLPSFIIEVSNIPLTINGKVAYNKLPKVKAEDLIKASYVAPTTDIEKQIVTIWQTILGVDKIGVEDNFLYLGGHSLKLLKLKNEYHKKFNVSLSLGELYNKNTIQETAAYIEFIMNQKELDIMSLNEIEI